MSLSNILKIKIILRNKEHVRDQKVIIFNYNIESDNPKDLANELVNAEIISKEDKKDFRKSIKKIIEIPELYYTSFKLYAGDDDNDNDDDDDDENIYVKYKRIGKKSRLPYAKIMPIGYIQLELVEKDESKIVIVNEYELIKNSSNNVKHKKNNEEKMNLILKQKRYRINPNHTENNVFE